MIPQLFSPKNRVRFFLAIGILWFGTSCTAQSARDQQNTVTSPTITRTHLQIELTPTKIATILPSPSPTIKQLTATITPCPTSTADRKHIDTPTTEAFPIEPDGCKKPPDDYTRVHIGGSDGWMINQRTFSMLQHAATLYNGEIDITGSAITQGSYSDNGPASFGTHLGGGAVDISVIRLPDYEILYDEIPPLIKALRTAGFAAWLRDPDEAYPGTGIHIHAIAIGDAELSYAAQQQLTGKFGYFRGYSGIPSEGTPIPDRHGGPIICLWMIEEGYSDLRITPSAINNTDAQ